MNKGEAETPTALDLSPNKTGLNDWWLKHRDHFATRGSNYGHCETCNQHVVQRADNHKLETKKIY